MSDRRQAGLSVRDFFIVSIFCLQRNMDDIKRLLLPRMKMLFLIECGIVGHNHFFLKSEQSIETLVC